MKKFAVAVLGVLSLAFLGSNLAYATDRYMATSGNDAGSCSSSSTPCSSLQYSMSQMNGGDTLYIDDGVYSGSTSAIDTQHTPPSGSSGAFTVIRAKNIPGLNGVPVNQPLKVRFTGSATFNVDNVANTSYVKFWGIRWNGVAMYTGWDHNYFKQCAFQGVNDGNTASITIGGKNNLLEDCVAFGKGRYKYLFYDYTRTGVQGDNLCRRCISRQDWAMKNDTATQNIASFTSYYLRGTAFLNSIAIDGDSPAYWQANPSDSASFYQPVDTGNHAMLIQGSIVINNALEDVATANGSTGHQIIDFASIKTAGGIDARGNAIVNRNTVMNANSSNFTYRSSSQRTSLNALADSTALYGASVTLSNTIFDNMANGVSGATSTYIDMYNISGSLGITPQYTVDPYANGLLYPVRIEAGSKLASSGSSAGQIGARIVNILGVDGTFKGDANWNTEQGALWPWPLEGWIQSEMQSMDTTINGDTMPNPYRGFCANGNGLYGGPTTLTSYIWESLGKPLPASIYSTSADTTAPTVAVTGPVNSTTVSGTVSVTANASDNVGVAKVEFYVNGALAATDTATPYIYSWNTASLAAGTYTLMAKAYDAAGNIGQSSNVTVSVVNDTTAPTVSLTAPGSGATVSGTVTIAAAASDNIGVSKVEFYENGVLLSASNVAPYSYSWNTATAANGSYNLTAKAYDASGNVGTSSAVTVTVSNSSTQPVPPASYTIWPSTTVPGVVDSGPDSAVEVGVKLRSDTAGSITGIRFYKASTNTGTHIGNLWDNTGKLLATTTFTNETASGWQMMNFAAPVAIAANTVYVASYHTNTGHYSDNQSYFSGKGVDTPPLHALADGTSGYSGVYAYGSASSFPNQGWNSSNYWVDVAFTSTTSTSTPSADTTAPTVAISSPTASATVSGTASVSVSATDNVGVSKVEFYVNSILQATDTASPYAFSWNTSALANGSYTMSAKAYDAAGNVGQSSAVGVTVNNPVADTTAPSVTISSPASSATVSGTATVTVSATDNVGISKVEFYVNGIIQATDTASPYTFSWNTASVVNGVYSLTAKAYDAAGNSGTSSTVSVTVSNPVATSTTYSVWSAATVPGVVDSGPDSAVEIGVKIRSDVNGSITGIRFYKASTNTGTHVANLWTSAGKLLATATFTGETASGWQQVNFSTPVAITANTVYVASYHSNVGHYSDDQSYFASKGVDNGSLHALADGVSGYSGVYAYGSASKFPNQGWNSSNYWVDVVFK